SSGADRKRPIPAERRVEEKRSIEEIQLNEAVGRVGSRRPAFDFDDPAETATKFRAIASGQKGERLDHFAVEGRAQTPEVIQGRDVDPVDIRARILRR